MRTSGGDRAGVAVSGTVAPGYEPVRDAFEENFRRRGEVGAAVHVIREGQVVVDLWAGWADAARSTPWTGDTLVNVWSTTKGWLALAMHMLADRGLLDFEAPVARYWPQFARNGKAGVLVRHLLTHTAGLQAPSVRVPPDALFDWDAMVHAMEESTPFWEPGTRTAYHAATFGWLNGEVLHRITGLLPGAFLRSEISGPLRADAFVGLGLGEIERTADTIPPGALTLALAAAMRAAGGRVRSLPFTNPARPPRLANTRRWREAVIPSSNGHASARGLARMYAPLAERGTAAGVRLLSPEAVARAGRPCLEARDEVIGMRIRRSLGFQLADPAAGDPRPASAFGHPGMGGSLGFADPGNRLAFGYVMNRMAFGLDTRAIALCRPLYPAR